MRTKTALMGLAILLVVAACGDDEATDTTTSTSTVATTTTTTEAPTTTTTEPPTTTTTTEPPTAADALADYLAEVDELMAAAERAALSFNISWQSSNTIDDTTKAAIEALDATPLRASIPAGLDPELEVAVLAVFADLDSMISSLHGAVRFESNDDDLEYCVGNGFTSLERFDTDRQRMIDLATAAPVPTAAPDSEEAGILAVRLEAIQSMNWGCDSCGGVAYDEAMPVDWDAQTVLDGVAFESEFADGRWQITILAC